MKKKRIISPEKKDFGKIRTRLEGYEGKQYKRFYSNKLKKWEWVHIRKAEKKYKIDNLKPFLYPKGMFQIHHINGKSLDNSEKNLILLHIKDHKELHLKKTLEVKRK